MFEAVGSLLLLFDQFGLVFFVNGVLSEDLNHSCLVWVAWFSKGKESPLHSRRL